MSKTETAPVGNSNACHETQTIPVGNFDAFCSHAGYRRVT